MVAMKLMKWSWQLNDLQRGGLTSRQFVRYQLMQLKLGDRLTHAGKSLPRPIASVEDHLVLKPGLNSTQWGLKRVQPSTTFSPPPVLFNGGAGGVLLFSAATDS